MDKILKNATYVGMFALLLWAIEPLVVSELYGFPLFEFLTIVFMSCFILTAIRLTILKKWKVVFQQSIFTWIFGTVMICGSDFAYILAAFKSPIAHVDLIDYLWPCIIVVAIGFFPNEKFKLKYIVGAILGLVGVLVLLAADGIENIKSEYIPGYLIAIFGVFMWGGYSIFSKKNSHIPSDMVGAYCGLGAIVTAILHFKFEPTIMPTYKEAGLSVLLGLAGPGLAYQLWDHGIKYGNGRLLSVSCYIARVLAMVLLVLFDKEPYSIELVIACLLTILGVVISSANYDNLLVIIKNFIKVTLDQSKFYLNKRKNVGGVL